MTAFRLDLSRGARFLAALALAAAAATTTASAEESLRTTKLMVGGHALHVEIAATDPQRMKGLMQRTKLGRDDGMLFIFDEPEYHAMWMKDTLIPLSVAFVDAQGTILNILDMEPQTLETHQSAGPSIYAIETNKGWFAGKKVKAGDKVAGLPKVR